MNTLFKSMDEILDYVTVDISGNFKTIKPYVEEAHKWALKGIDKATFDSLVSYYNETDPETDEDIEALIPYVQRVLANFAYAVSAKRLGIFVGENGMMEFNNANLTPLNPEKLDQYKTEFFQSGFNALEQLILFIQENKDTYETAYSYLFDNAFFISTAAAMNALIFTDVQNRDYFDMKPDIFLIESDIEAIITSTGMAELKAATSPDESQTKMISLCNNAEACLAYGNKFKSDKHIEKGRGYMEQLRNYYATLTNTPVERWDNEDKTIYVF